MRKRNIYRNEEPKNQAAFRLPEPGMVDLRFGMTSEFWLEQRDSGLTVTVHETSTTAYSTIAIKDAAEILQRSGIAVPPRFEDDQCIYFLRSGEFVKIGESANLECRIEKLQMCCPYPITPALIVRGMSVEEEKKFHQIFAADRIHGEWFKLSRGVADCIARYATCRFFGCFRKVSGFLWGE